MLAVVTILFSSTVALILGIGAALRANGAFDRSVLVYVAVALATPSFWLGIILVLIFSIKLTWLPAIDMTGPKSFVLRLASGDPARMMNPPGQPEDLVQLTREKIGTDRPLMVQYWIYA